ncbi:MAG: GTP 3',8-cyclase MoaA [Gammaproteobacteria bacterium]|nr:GTP 3',8-cyclase MoaA [Gammaproteobacteria bacterium]
MLQDNFGRKFEYLRLSITDACNFRCNYCLPDGYDCLGERDYMSLSEIQTLVSAFAQLGTKKVRITGGEPALRKDLTDIIALCANTPGIEQVALTTNGFNLEKKIEQWLNAGLTNLNVSADSLDPRMFETITGSSKLENILAGITKAQALGFDKIKLNAVLLKQFNLSMFDDYLAWLRDNAITVRFIELMETGSNQLYFQQNHVSGSILKQQLLDQGWSQVIRDKLAGPAQEFYHAEYAGKIGLIMPYSNDFCQTCNRLRVSSHGQLHLCLFTEQGIDLRSSLKERDIEQTKLDVIASMSNKKLSHELQQNITGINQHFASIGG